MWLRCGAVTLTLLSASFSWAAPAPEHKPNILLIVLDTVRYDATSFGNPVMNNTPFLASLGAQGVVFTNAYSTHDFTPTSHFSMMTGLFDGVGTTIDRAELGLPYQLDHSGYDTFATVANQLLRPAALPALGGFKKFLSVEDIDQGTIPLTAIGDVDHRLRQFGCQLSGRNRAMTYYSAQRLLPIFLDQIRAAKEPFFGFVNLLDAHEPYAPDPNSYALERDRPAGFDGDVMARKLGPELANPDAIKDPARREYVKGKIDEVVYPKLVAVDLPRVSLDIYRERYLAKVRELDGVLRQFFVAMQHENRLANTVVIIASDHGEAFGEDDVITHMFGDKAAIEATHHVPLIVILPPSMRTTASINRRVSIAGIAPLIYDLAGLDPSPLHDAFPSAARSLLPLFGETPARTGKVVLPEDASAVNAEARRAMENTMRALGYLQ